MNTILFIFFAFLGLQPNCVLHAATSPQPFQIQNRYQGVVKKRDIPADMRTYLDSKNSLGLLADLAEISETLNQIGLSLIENIDIELIHGRAGKITTDRNWKFKRLSDEKYKFEIKVNKVTIWIPQDQFQKELLKTQLTYLVATLILRQNGFNFPRFGPVEPT